MSDGPRPVVWGHRVVRGLGSALPRRRTGRHSKLVGLVDDGDGDLLELVAVLASVVSAEQKLTAGLELNTKVGLGTTSVTAVLSGQRGAGGGCSRHVRPHLFSVGAVSNVARGCKIPTVRWCTPLDPITGGIPQSVNSILRTRREEHNLDRGPRCCVVTCCVGAAESDVREGHVVAKRGDQVRIVSTS